MSFASRILFFFLCLTFAYQLISLLRGTGHRSEPYIPPRRPTTAPNPHGRTSTSRVLNLRLGPPPEIFLGSSTVLAGELLPRTRFGTTADHVHDDELPVVWVGIDGESDIHRLCDLYWAGKLSPLHGVFPRTLHPHSDDERHGVSLLNGRPRPFEALLGDEIQREGNFALCVYDESEISPEVAEAMENAQREALRSGKDAENILSSRKLPTGRYIYTGLHLKVSRTSAIGLHLITSLRPTPNQNPTVAVDRLSSIRSALENRFIAEVHLLQETEDLSVFPEDITKHRKFRYTVVGAPLTYAMAFEYGRRELEDRRVLITNPDTTFDVSLQHLQSIHPFAFYTHVYVLAAQPPGTPPPKAGDRLSATVPLDYDSLVLIPSQLGQPRPLRPTDSTAARDPAKLTRALAGVVVGQPGAESRVLYEIQKWLPSVVVWELRGLVNCWRRPRDVLGPRVDAMGKRVKNVKIGEGMLEEGWNDPE